MSSTTLFTLEETLMLDYTTDTHNRYSNEINIMGPHIFGRGRSYLERVAPTTRENRDLFVDFCTAND